MLLDSGLLLLRLVVGLMVAAHGAQKLFGWFGGGGIAGTQKMTQGMNVHPSLFWAWVSALDEFVGGLLTALGLLMPLGPLMIIANMLVAILYVHGKNGFWNTNRGIEFPLLLSTNALVLGLIGAGAYSIDALIGFALPEPKALVVGLIAVVIGFGFAVISGSALMREASRRAHTPR